MTKISQGNKKITARKIPAANKKSLVRTGSLIHSLRFFKKHRQAIIKFRKLLGNISNCVKKIFSDFADFSLDLCMNNIYWSLFYCNTSQSDLKSHQNAFNKN